MKYLVLCFVFFQLSASIQSISEVDAPIDHGTLVVFDVDDVLIKTEDQFFHPKCEHLIYPIMEELIQEAPDAELALNRLSLALTDSKRCVLEEETVSLIKNLQEREIKVIALTSCPTGPFGYVEKVERWRIEDLKGFGFDFSKAFPIDRLELTKIKREGFNAPLFEEGILFSKGYKKGEVLKHFLREIHYKPKRVIFIDDLLDNVESMEVAMESVGIECHAYQYTRKEDDFIASEELLRKQLAHAVEHGEWLSDAQVMELVELETDHSLCLK